LWINPAAGNSAQDNHLLTPPLPLQWDGEEKWTKGKPHGLRLTQFNKSIKEILLLVLILIIIMMIMITMNMQKTLYTIHFFSQSNNRFAATA